MATQTRVNSGKSLSVSKLICGLLIVALAAFGGYYFYKYQDLNNKYQEQNLTVEDKTARYVDEVSKLFDIPSLDKEKPTIAEISSESNLDEIKKINKFYEQAQVGDVLLAYKDANISILYRPGEKKIIKTDDYTTALALQKAEIAIIAPTSEQSRIEESISSRYTNIVIVSKTEPNSNLTKGIVVDVTGSEAEAAKQLAEILGYEVGEIPSGEKAPKGAKLVIVAPKAQ
jgi:hypothetical protein